MLNSFHVPHCKVVLCRGKPFTYWPISNSTVSGRRFCLFHITGLISVLGIQKHQLSREFSTSTGGQKNHSVFSVHLRYHSYCPEGQSALCVLIPKPPLGLIRFHFTKTPMYNHLIHTSCKIHTSLSHFNVIWLGMGRYEILTVWWWQLYPRALRMIRGSGGSGNTKMHSDYLQVGRGWIR